MCILALCFFFSQAACGQSLSLNEYLDLLKKKNYQLRQGEISIQLAGEKIKEARADLLPGLSTDASYKRDFTKSYMYLDEGSAEFPSKFKMNYKNNFAANLMAEQVLFSPLGSANYKLSVLAEEMAELQQQDLSKEVLHQGTLLFYQAIYAKESIVVLEENKTIAKSQWNKMKSMFEEGFVSEIQVRKSELYYKRAIPILESVKTDYCTILNSLKQLAGLPISSDLNLKGNIESEDRDLLPKLYDENLNFNSKIKILSKQVEMSNQQIKMAKALKYPSVKAGLGYSYNAADDQFKLNHENKVWFGQLSVQIPIISGGRNTAKIKIAKLEQSRLQLEKENSKLTLRKDIENANLKLRYSLEKIEEEKELICLSEKELSVANEQISLGAITPLEFKEIRLELTKAKLGLLNAQLDHRIANLQLQKILQN